MLEELPAQVSRKIVILALAINDLLRQFFGGIFVSYEQRSLAAQRVVFVTESVTAAVPGAQRLLGDLHQAPPLSSIGAGLVNTVRHQIVGIGHDPTAKCVGYCELLPFDVEFESGDDALFGYRSVSLRAVEIDGEECASEAIEIGGLRSIGVQDSLLGSFFCLRS